ncbi:MAG: helix-turn-helix domain-containing protein [Fimbriimonas sp.]
MEPESATLADIGARIRSLRLARGLTQVELAAEAGVHRTVVARAEAGGDCRWSSVQKIAVALGVTATWMNRPFLGPLPYRVDRRRDTMWVATRPSFVRRKGIVTRQMLRDPAERARLGAHGLANAFIRVMNTELPGGRIHALIVESYRKEQDPVGFPGQMWLYILQGRVRFQMGDDSTELEEGDAIGYWADRPHLYESLGDDGPAVVLEIFITLSDAEIAVREEFSEYPNKSRSDL